MRPSPQPSRFVHYLSHSSQTNKQATNKPTTAMSTANNTNYSPSGHNLYQMECIMCCKDIVRDSDDHDHCVLVNKGYDLICQDCPRKCKTECGECVVCEDPSESESEDEPEEISTCNCKPDWDIRCCCYPPMITRSFPATMTDGDIGWYKKDGHQDNWDNCPMKVGNAVWHYTNSRLSNDNRTKKGEYNLKYAKWVFGLMGLNQAQVKEATAILKEQREED